MKNAGFTRYEQKIGHKCVLDGRPYLYVRNFIIFHIGLKTCKQNL